MLLFSKFKYNFNTSNDRFVEKTKYVFDSYSGLNDFTLKSAIDFIPNNTNYLKIGLEATNYNFTPQYKRFTTTDSLLDGFENKQKTYAFATAAFAEDEIVISDFLKTNIGLRTTNYKLSNKSYWSYEPRLSLIFSIKDWYFKAAYSRMQQNLHLLTNSGIGFQNDIWVPSTDKVQPQKSSQFALGISKYWQDADIEMSIEAYDKKMYNLIDYKEGSNILKNADDWYKSVEVNGIGWSKGIELFLNKKTGRFNGFLSYTLSKTDRQFSKINNGQKYPFRYDSRHVINLTGNYKINTKWDVSATWVFKSGEPITIPAYTIEVPKFDSVFGTNELPIYIGRNSYRLPTYHRADLNFNKTKITKKGRTKTWSFGVYNLYNRRNILYVQLTNRTLIDSKGKFYFERQLQAKSLFSAIPHISYSLSW